MTIILIYGLEKGLGIEICKNLLNLEIQKLLLLDNENINNNDLETGYLYSKQDIGLKRSEILSKKLNSNFIINYCNNYKQNQNITILINKSLELINEVNTYTRLINSKLIVLNYKGLSGYIFMDVGLDYKYYDNINDYIPINNILNDGTVLCCDKHNLKNNDIIKFEQLEGDNIEKLNKEWEITIKDNKSFLLKNFYHNNFNFINGYIKKEPQFNIINHNIFKFNNKIKENNDNFELMPLVSIFGGLVSFEIYKLITNKYLPINQWLFFEENKEDLLDIEFLNPEILIIGSSGLGNEHIKNLSFMNIKNITITDPKKVNSLNKTFLFNKLDINKYKSEILKEKILNLKNININSLKIKIDENTQDIDKIINNKIILSGIDNIEDRKFIANKCYKNNLLFFDCGISNYMGHSFPVIPYITETYQNQNDFEMDKSFPLCVLNSFPNCIDHTIEWAKEIYNILKEKYYLKIEDFRECIKISLEIFNEYFNFNIKKLLETYEPNHITLENNLFWSKGKKCPKLIEFDINNDLHLKFIELTLTLLGNYKIDITKEIILNEKIKIEKDLELNDIKKEWIKITSKLRSINYNIIYLDENKSNISMNGLISGLITLEILKDKNYKNTFINLSENLIIRSEYKKSEYIEINGQLINTWTKFIYTKNSTLKEFKNYHETLFNIIITMMVIDTKIIYCENLEKNNLNKNLSDIINENNVFISLLCEDDDINLPDININLKKIENNI